MEGHDSISAEERQAFAHFLSDARQQAGVSLGDISQRTKVSTRYLEALETGHVEALPAAVYRRAILRAYAANVGLDERTAIDWFERVFGDEAARPFRLETPDDPPPASNPWTWKLPAGRTIAAAAAIVLVLAFGARAVWSRAAVPADEGVTASLVVEAGSDNQEVATVGEQPAVERSDIRLPDAPPPPPPPPSSPRLVVTSLPAGARVTVDGIGWGVTPVTIRHLPPGEKVIRVTKDGYLGRERRIQIDDGGSASVRVTLRPRG